MAVSDVNSAPLALRIGGALKLAKNLGILTDTNVAAANTVALLRSTIAAASIPVGGDPNIREKLDKAIRDGADALLFTDALLNPLTTVDGLIALTGAPANAVGESYY